MVDLASPLLVKPKLRALPEAGFDDNQCGTSICRNETVKSYFVSAQSDSSGTLASLEPKVESRRTSLESVERQIENRVFTSLFL